MDRPRVLITGCGGPAAVGFTRSLLRTDKYDLLGTDCNLFALPFGETATRHLVPPASEPRFVSAINELIEAERIDFVHAQPDAEVIVLSKNRDRLKAPILLPAHSTVEICQDKYESLHRWRRAGIKVPDTLLLTKVEDLRLAFEQLSLPFWIRSRRGYGGRGSFIVRNIEAAEAWIDEQSGWGGFTASELLPGRLVTWQSLWLRGELICAQGRERLSWMMGNATASGVSGITRVARTISRRDVDEVARKAILSIDNKPHGIFGVDLKEDRSGVPCPTEINIGRFFTTIQFFTELGLNMPDMYVSAGLGQDVEALRERYNPLPPDWYWLRSVDSLPMLAHAKDVLAEHSLCSTEVLGEPDATVTYAR
jgi:carbamoyl-phosphate synthase large subunit